MIYGNYYDCTKTRKGTNIPNCVVPEGVPEGFHLVPKGWTQDPSTDTFDTAFIKAQIKLKKMFPFLDAINYTANNEEDVKFTTQLGVQLLVRDGKPFFSYDFTKGYNWHTAAFSFNSFGDFDLIPYYSNGVVFMARTSDGKYKGHSAGLVNTQTYKQNDGQNPAMTTIEIQLTDPHEWNNNGVLLDPAANGFDIKANKGIIDINIDILSNDAADVVVKCTMGVNGAIPVLGLGDSDFRAIGTENAISAVVDNGDGTYTITFAADVSADYVGLVIETFDSNDSSKVVDINNILYEGVSAPAAA